MVLEELDGVLEIREFLETRTRATSDRLSAVLPVEEDPDLMAYWTGVEQRLLLVLGVRDEGLKVKPRLLRTREVPLGLGDEVHC